MEDEGTSLAQDVVNPAASDTHIVCGWMVSLEQLAIEGLVWKKLRVLYLIRDRQATSGPAASSRFAKRLAFNLAGLPRELFDDILQLVERDARLQACQDLTFPDQHEGCPCEAFTSNRQKANRKIRLRKARAVWVTSPLTYETPFDLPIQEVQDERLAEFLWEYDRLKLPKACMQSEWTRRSQRQCERLWSMRWESLSHYDFEEPKVLDYWSPAQQALYGVASDELTRDQKDKLAEAIRILLEETGHRAILLQRDWQSTFYEQVPEEREFVAYFKSQPRLLIPKVFNISHTSGIGRADWDAHLVNIDRRLYVYKYTKSPLFDLVARSEYLAWKVSA